MIAVERTSTRLSAPAFPATSAPRIRPSPPWKTRSMASACDDDSERSQDEPWTATTPTSSAAANTIASSRPRPVRARVSSPARTMDVLRTGSSRPLAPRGHRARDHGRAIGEAGLGSHTGQP